MERQEAVDTIQHALKAYAPLRKVAIQVSLAEKLNEGVPKDKQLQIPAAKVGKGKAIVKFFAKDIFDVADLEFNAEAAVDENFYKNEEERLLKLIDDTPPGPARDNFKVEMLELREKFAEVGDATEVEEEPVEEEPTI